MLDTFPWISSYDHCNYLVTSLQASSLGGGGVKEGNKMERELACTSQEFEYLHENFEAKC